MAEQMPSMTHAIRQEAKRFEGLQHNLADLYRLLQQIDNIPVKIQMRELVNNIEDCFQNSPEFTVLKPSSNYELKLGIIGSSSCGKSDLVHRYVTGECSRDESLNGCRKKEVIVDGQSYLLLIRNETGFPDFQFVQWIDALMLVFNIDDELSSSMLPGYFARMTQYRDFTDIPLFLVGIKDHGAKCTTDMHQFNQVKKRLVEVNDCTCTEICVKTGESVDMLFQMASEKMVNRDSAMLTSYDALLSPARTETRSTSSSSSTTNSSISSRTTGTVSPISTPSSKPRSGRRRTIIFGSKTDKAKDEIDGDQEIGVGRFIPVKQGSLLKRTQNSLNKEWKKKFVVLDNGGILTYYPSVNDYIEDVHGKHIFLKQSTVKTPGKRPLIASKQPRTSSPKIGKNGTPRASSVEDELHKNHRQQQNGSLIISNDFLSQDNNADISPPLYKDANAVKAASPNLVKSKSDAGSLVRKRGQNRRGNKHTKSCELDFSNFPQELQKTLIAAGESSVVTSGTVNDYSGNNSRESKTVQSRTSEKNSHTNSNEPSRSSSKKKSHRRSKSHGTGKFSVASDVKTDVRNGQGDEYEFRIVSLDGNSWNFAAQSVQERDEWVFAIEQQILTCLQSNFSGRDKINSNSSSESDLLPIRNVPGNNVCADCGEPNPDWATLNLGALICITCCGIHRNLGTHLSRVRSLDLDDWPLEFRAVMLSIGNNFANNIWEARLGAAVKPQADSPREEKEYWIRTKYKKKSFLEALPSSDLSLGQQLIEAIRKEDLGLVIPLLAHSKRKDVNEREEDDLMRTPLHISCCKGNVVITLLLIWYFADVMVLDGLGRTALWYACEIGSRECEEVLRSNGCCILERSCSESSNSGDLTS